MGYPVMMNPKYCIHLRKLGKSAGDQELGIIECILRIKR